MGSVTAERFTPTGVVLVDLKRFVICSTVAIVLFVTTICGLSFVIFYLVRNSDLVQTLETTDWTQETQVVMDTISIVQSFVRQIESKRMIDETTETITNLNQWVADASSNHTIDKIIRLVNRLDGMLNRDHPVSLSLAQRLMGLT